MNRSIAIALLVTLALPLGACGNSTESADKPAASATAGSFNDADVTFAQGMIPHHEQAVEMADMALDPTTSAGPKIVDLAKRIKGAQDPEIRLMKGWLTTWGKDLMGSDHSGHSMSGMMTVDDLAKLGAFKGATFDKRWAELMVEHHKGALEQANAVIRDGKAAAVKTLAADILKGQKAEIDEMLGIIKTY